MREVLRFWPGSVTREEEGYVLWRGGLPVALLSVEREGAGYRGLAAVRHPRRVPEGGLGLEASPEVGERGTPLLLLEGRSEDEEELYLRLALGVLRALGEEGEA